jgi:hypothetical protein
MRIFLVSTLLLLATPALGASLNMANGYGSIDAPRDVDPQTLGQMFCDARISGDMQPLEPYFAPKLVNLLEETEGSRLSAAIPWQSYIYHPTACSIEIVNGYDDTIGVLVAITYDAPEQTWSDTINLDRTPDSWRINNVFYEGGGNLRFRLFEALPN